MSTPRVTRQSKAVTAIRKKFQTIVEYTKDSNNRAAGNSWEPSPTPRLPQRRVPEIAAE